MLRYIFNWTAILGVAAVVCLSHAQSLSADKGKGGSHKGGSHKGGGHKGGHHSHHHSGGHHHGGSGKHRDHHHHHHHYSDSWRGGWYAPGYSSSWNTWGGGVGFYSNPYWNTPSSYYYDSYYPYYTPSYQGSFFFDY